MDKKEEIKGNFDHTGHLTSVEIKDGKGKLEIHNHGQATSDKKKSSGTVGTGMDIDIMK